MKAKRSAAARIPVLLLLAAAAASGQVIDFDKVRSDEEFRGGVQAFHNGFYNEAVAAFKKSLTYKPKDPAARLWLGRAYYQSGLNDAALAEWRAVAKAGGDSPLLENLIDTLESRRGIGRELRGPEKWVVSGEISGKFGDNVLFRRPSSVRARRDGSFFVVGFVTNRVIVLDSNGIVRKTLWGGLEGFDHPFDIVEDRDGSVYVSEFRGDRIAKCDRNGNRILTIGGKGRGPGLLLGPQYLALDPDGNLYVSDWGNKRVSKYSRKGEFLLSFGRPAGVYPGLGAPAGVLFHDGNVYVADAERKHVAVFDTSGNHLSTVLRNGVDSFEGMTRLPDGRFLISDGRRLFQYSVEEDSLTLLSDFGGVAKRVLSADRDANGNVLASDFDGGVVHVLSELTGMHTGLTVMIRRVDARDHPEVQVEAHVSNRYGNPVVGLAADNFIISENRVRMTPTEMVFASHRSERFDIALVADRSPEMAARRSVVERVARDAAERIGGAADFRVVSAGAVPAVVSRPGDPPAVMARAAADTEKNYADSWAFDLGVRMGVTELLGSRARKAVFFISSGGLPKTAFRNYGLRETADYLKNNSVAFYPIYVTASGDSPELEFLAGETGGRSYRYFDALALTSLAEDLAAQPDGTYVLKYRSPNPTDFGRVYMPLEIEASLVRRSGRDEAGYFGPLEF